MIEFTDRVAKLIKSGSFDEAEQLVASVATSDPALHAAGRAALAVFARDAEAALKNARRALELAPSSAVPHHYLATAYLLAGDPDSAVRHAREAIERDRSLRSRSGLGGVLLAAGRPADAIPVLQQVIAEDPGNAEALLNLGTAHLQTSQYGEALVAYARAFDADPTDQRPLQSLIHMYAEIGKWLGAVAALEMSRKGEPPDEVSVALDIVLVHLMKLIASKYPERNVSEDADQPIDNLLRSAARRPPRVQLVVARTLVDFGRLDDARTMVERLGKQALGDTDRGDLRYLDGLLAERRGDKRRALELYVESLEADARRSDACANAISLLLEEGTPDAFAHIADLVTIVPDEDKARSPELLFNEGVYHLRAGHPGEARRALERVLRVTGGEGRIAALARKALGDAERASS